MPRGRIAGSYDKCMVNKPLPRASVSFCILTSNAWAFLLVLLRTLSNCRLRLSTEAFIPLLETSEGEHLFMCLFVICIPFLLKCLLKSLCISYWFFYFPIIDFREFITYILDIISLSDIWFINISSKPVVSFFIILTESFEKQNFNLLIKSNLSFFF